MKLFAQAADYDADRSVLPWALAIAGWECRTIRRRTQRRRECGLDDANGDPADGAASAEDRLVHAAMLAEAEHALSFLSEADRQTLAWAFSEARPHERPVSGATFRKRRQRALGRLREVWRSLYG